LKNFNMYTHAKRRKLQDVLIILTGNYTQSTGYCRHVHTYQHTKTKANRKFRLRNKETLLQYCVCGEGRRRLRREGGRRLQVWRLVQRRNRIIDITAPRLYCNIFSIAPHATLYNFFTVSMLKIHKFT
jgi:hypothetical protein